LKLERNKLFFIVLKILFKSLIDSINRESNITPGIAPPMIL